MKRDKDLILKILRWAEGEQKPKGSALSVPDFRGYDTDYVYEHVRLCVEAGYLAPGRTAVNSPDFTKVRRITWLGHEHLDANRGKTLTCPE